MTSFPSRNTKISLIGLSAIGLVLIATVIYNVDKWLAGGVAVNKVVQTCSVLGDGCSSAISSILQIIGGPQQLMLSFVLATLLLAALKAVAVVFSAGRITSKYRYLESDQVPSKIDMALRDLKAENIRIRLSDDDTYSAFTYGIFKPAICLSKGLVDNLSHDELKALVAHEVGHIKRHDNFAIFFALFFRDFLWFLPISHHLFATFIREKEYAADDYAVGLTGKPLELAGAVVSVAKALSDRRILSPAYATFFTSKATAKTRVGRLLGIEDKSIVSRRSLVKLIASFAISVLMIVAAIGVAYGQPYNGGQVANNCSMGGVCVENNYTCCNSK